MNEIGTEKSITLMFTAIPFAMFRGTCTTLPNCVSARSWRQRSRTKVSTTQQSQFHGFFLQTIKETMRPSLSEASTLAGSGTIDWARSWPLICRNHYNTKTNSNHFRPLKNPQLKESKPGLLMLAVCKQLSFFFPPSRKLSDQSVKHWSPYGPDGDEIGL
jgi:hypothetical protein